MQESCNFGSKLVRIRKCMECGTSVYTLESIVDDDLGAKLMTDYRDMEGGGTA